MRFPSILNSFLFIFLLVSIASIVRAQSTEFAPSNTAPDVESVSLDRSVVCSWCSSGLAQCSDPKSQYVEVNTIVSDKENNIVTISYQVTAGRIVGQGRRVFWHLEGAKPGVHKVTVIADDGGGPRGRRVTKEVEVKLCSAFLIKCDCPKLTVTPSSMSVVAGEVVSFSVAANDSKSRKYVWMVSSGRIIDGMGTSTIKVKTDSSTSLITAAVEIKQELCNCENGASESVQVKQ